LCLRVPICRDEAISGANTKVLKDGVRGFSFVPTALKGRTTKIWGWGTLEMPEAEREIKV